jgi:starch-binding outer membrane protein, SusD/RagB family
MRALAIPGALAITLVTGCDLGKTLQVQPANLIDAGALEKPESAPLLVTGAAADFDCAFNSYVAVGALIGEELEDATQTASRWPYDQRLVAANSATYATSSCTGLGVYTPLQSSRVSASNIRRLMEGWTDVQVPGRQLLIARAAAYEAWSQLLIAESFCETVFSSVDGENINYGTKITRAQALDSAIARFGQTITIAQANPGVVSDSLRFFALVGRARAYQDKFYITNAAADMAAARADAAIVPATWVWNVTASSVTGRRNNRVFQESNSTVTQQSSSVGAYYRTLNDPRVPVQNMNRLSQGTNVPQWAQRKYVAVTSSIPAATGTEMQLLIAEADRTSNRANTLAIIAASRLAGNQPAYTGTTAAQDLAEIYDQRRRALWLTGVNLGDVIRYNITLTPAAGTNTPWGQQYGPANGAALCMPLPEVEIFNNPLLH